jgi:hypothetical protein
MGLTLAHLILAQWPVARGPGDASPVSVVTGQPCADWSQTALIIPRRHNRL